MHEQPSSARCRLRWAGLLGGPLLALLAYLLTPDTFRDAGQQIVPFSTAARATLAVMTWMAVWWLTEAIEIAATALLPLALFPLLGVADIRVVAAPYANPLIFLFLGGFLIALSMQRWGLDRRLALRTLLLVGSRPRSMIGGFMIGTAGLSMFVSNTATTAMMLPIGVSLIELVRPTTDDAADPAEGQNFALCLMLGIAYAASIGGVATIIGTPPNALLAGFVRETISAPYRMDLGFAHWVLVGLPLTLVFLPLTWLLLTRVLYPVRIEKIPGGRKLVREELARLGPAGRGEWTTGIVFCATAVFWMTRPLLPLPGLSDAGIAMIAALLLFVIPVDVRRRRFTMDWRAARDLPWGILLLFGGGLSLAAMVQRTGVAEFIGSAVGHLPALPPLVLILAVSMLVIFLTELTSNTATTATLLPILAAMAPGLGMHPYLLIVPATMAASCAFMMPVATPPNAIVFGSGFVSIPQMCRAGLWLNLIGVGLISVLTWALVGPLLAGPG